MTFRVTKSANNDVIDAEEWYDAQQVGLGERFRKNVFSKIDQIISFPKSYQIRYKKSRCAKVDYFPFMIHYIIEKSTIVIIAVGHTSRNPKIWLERTKNN